MAAAGVQALDLAPVGVEADDLVPRFGEGDGERQPDVAEPDDVRIRWLERYPCLDNGLIQLQLASDGDR